MRDIANNIGAVQAVAPAVLTATNTSAAIDLLGFNSAAVFIETGAIVGAGNFTAKLQESDASGSGFADVAAADLVGTLPAVLLASSVAKQGYIGNKRYLRTVITLNSGTSIAASAIVVKGNAANKPVS
ncbi:hypothetical protein [Mesorhizobium sp. AA22]|uniref:hypothetical protein n=1 Tax=Mesorhizobium sp. AA22 TaxID=1854057 RepID=UPI0007EDC986|nr:hypothetical protein [Mesorhizobium sp. AA22]QIA23100.1 hypothetical protein A9K68_015955 [Mesorhizobium sp. AA22]